METQLELYHSVTSLAGLGIFECNLITGNIYWNEIIRTILEVNAHFKPALEESLKFYKDTKKVHKLIDRAVSSGLPQNATLAINTAQGNDKWVKINLKADCVDGICVRLYGTLVDVTQNSEIIALLKEKEKRFSMAFDYAPIGMALVSLNGSWIKVNMSLCSIFGYSEHEFLQHTFQNFTHPDDLEGDLKQLNQLLLGTLDTYSMEKRYFHSDGHIIWALLNVSVVRDEAEQPLYFISQIKDITERKKITETIRNQNSRLLNFAHIVSHNLRSHTGNMQMLTDMILKEDDPTERDNLITMLKENSGNLLETLEHLNEVVKVNDSSQIDRVSLNLKAAVNRVLDILSASIKQCNALITIDLADTLHVMFFPSYLESVIVNLISNSLKYRHPDRLAKVNIAAEGEGQYTTLRVSDNGQGIDLELHGHKLFGMYKTFHRHPEARGMGLFLVKNQVEAMGGTITAESEVGLGTTFIVTFNKL